MPRSTALVGPLFGGNGGNRWRGFAIALLMLVALRVAAQDCDTDCPPPPSECDDCKDPCQLGGCDPLMGGGTAQGQPKTSSPSVHSNNRGSKSNVTSDIKTKSGQTIFSTSLSPGTSGPSIATDSNALTGAPQPPLRNPNVLPSFKTRAMYVDYSALRHTEPVGADGEFVLDETDINLPGIGVPFIFSRHYRSGASFQTPLGYGWNHNFNLRLVAASVVSSDGQLAILFDHVYLVTERLERIEFVHTGVSADGASDEYMAQAPTGMRLTTSHSWGHDWTLDKGDGEIDTFDAQYKVLRGISDRAGHTLQVNWQLPDFTDKDTLADVEMKAAQGIVSSVVDTTGRTVYFHYAQGTMQNPAPNSDSIKVSGNFNYQYLQCLSLDAGGCTSSLVSFEVSPMFAIDTVANWTTSSGKSGTDYNGTTEFDLAIVHDAEGNGPSYYYYTGGYTAYLRDTGGRFPSAVANQICSTLQSDSSPLGAAGTCKGIVADTIQADCLASCTRDPGPPTAATEAACAHVIKSCLSDRNGDVGDLTQACTDAAQAACAARTPKQYLYGSAADLFHQMIEMDDADGRQLVKNTYGADITKPGYARVREQLLAGDPQNTSVFSYHDFKAPANPDDAQFLVSGPFSSTAICPIASDGSYGDARLDPFALIRSGRIVPSQVPEFAIVAKGPLNQVTVSYFDAAWRILREDQKTSAQVTDYNYSGAFLSAVRFPFGNRMCQHLDDRGRPTRIAEIPAPGRIGKTVATALAYDDAGEIIADSRVEGSTLLFSRHIERDPWERVTAIGEMVDAAHVRWTCMSYADSRATLLAPAQKPGKKEGPPHIKPWVPSGCAAKQTLPVAGTAISSGQIDAIPSTITRPDGSFVQLASLSAGGAGEATVDAAGQSPLRYYYRFDDFGRLAESGRRNGAGQPLDGSQTLYLHDRNGVLTATKVSDPANPGKFIEAVFGHDKSRHLTQVDTSLLSISLKVDPLGQINRVVRGAPAAKRKGPPDPTLSTPVIASLAGAPIPQRARCWRYNSYGDVMAEVDEEGVVTEYDYAVPGRLLHVSKGAVLLPPGKSLGPWATGCTPKAVNIASILVGSSGPNVRETMAKFEYNGSGELLSSTKEGVETKFMHDGFGRVIDEAVFDHSAEATLPNGKKVTKSIFTHTSIGYVGNQIAWTSVANDYLGNLTQPPHFVSGLSARTDFAYDLLGRLVKRVDWQFSESTGAMLTPPAGVETFAYDDAKNAVTTTTASGSITYLQKDGADRPFLEVLGKGSTAERQIQHAYSADALSETETLSPAPTSTGARTRSFAFDPTGYLKEIDDQGVAILTQSYDSFHRMSQQTSASGGEKAFLYNPFGNLVKISQTGEHGKPMSRLLGWNRDGSIHEYVDGNGNVTGALYDYVGRASSVTDGLGTATFTYVSGTEQQIKLVTSPAAHLAREYDAAGRVVKIVASPQNKMSGSSTTVLRYSPLNQVISATEQDQPGGPNTISRTYDSTGRMLSESSDASAYSVQWSYAPHETLIDIVRNAKSIHRLRRQFDELGRPHKLELDSKPVASFAYDQGDLSAITFGNGTASARQYDSQGRATGFLVKRGTDVLSELDRGLDAAGITHQRSLSIAGNVIDNQAWVTDPALRPVAEQALSPSVAIPASGIDNDVATKLLESGAVRQRFDAANNLVEVAGGSESFSATVDGANRFKSLVGSTVTNWDGAGAQVYGDEQFSWDAFSAARSMTNSNDKREWKRDAFGRVLVERDQSGASRQFVWAGAELIGVAPANDPNAAVALRVGYGAIDDLQAFTSDTGRLYSAHSSSDGSVFAATDSSGNLAEAYSYSTFGRTRFWSPDGTSRQISSIDNPYLYKGQRYDAAMGIYAMGARIYSPRWGRFLSPDPSGPGDGLNLFAYADSRPIQLSDPEGLNSRSAEDLLPGASTDFLQSGPNLDGTTSILPIGKYALLAGGTVSDLFLALAWKVLGMSKSGEHLMHARFGNGEERRVTQEWVQQGWGEHYEAMRQQSFQSAFRDIAKQYSAGAHHGTGQLTPNTEQWSAYGWFSDQHWASGGATLSIAGIYRWYVGHSGRIDVAFEVQSRFYDDYRFRADGNLLHHSMQSLGQITPFPVTGDWTERSRWTIDPNETANRAVPATELPEPPRLFP